MSDPLAIVVSMIFDDSTAAPGHEAIVIDCDDCVVRGDACSDCVVSVLLGPPETLAGVERAALAVLAGSGLVPPLRLVRAKDPAA